MKKTIVIILLFVSTFVKGQQLTWEFVNKLYVIDNIGNVDSVLFGNDSSATLGIDTMFNEQNIIGTTWDSLEIRSIQRTSDSIDCPMNYWQYGIYFVTNTDLKIDMRKSETYLYSSIFYVFKIHATHYPIDIYSDFGDMFNNSYYNSWTAILKHQYECSYDDAAGCVSNYQHLFTIVDSNERYISIRLDFETGVSELTNTNHNLIFKNPVDNFLTLDYCGRIQIYEIGGKILMDCIVNENNPVNVGQIKPGMYLIKTESETLKMIKN